MPDQRPRRRKDQAADLDAVGLEIGSGNKPPQAVDLEEAVLGALLIEPGCVDDAVDELNKDCFYNPRHQLIFEAIRHLVDEHEPVDTYTVAQRLLKEGNLEEIGGQVVLSELSMRIASAAHIEAHIKVLKQKAIQRGLITACLSTLRDAYDESANVDNLVDDAQSRVFAAIENHIKNDVQDIGFLIKEAIDNIEEMQDKTGYSGVPSGYPPIDAVTMGWQPSNLIILAARPSVGKTAFALNVARNAAVDYGMGVAFFSLEMGSMELVRRLITTETELPAYKIKGGGKLESYEWEQLNIRLKALIKAPIYIDSTASLPISEFRSKAKRLVNTMNVRLIIVDYLQLMQGPVELRGIREQEVAAISRTLKATAKELNVPIIALSQLNRQAVARTQSNGRPQLSDLRESGSIEQDADLVIFIHRPDQMGLGEEPDSKEKSYIMIAKNRNGETKDIEMRYKCEKMKFVEIDADNLVRSAREVASAMNNAGFTQYGNGSFDGNADIR